MKKFIKENVWFFFGLLVLAEIVIANLFPGGYVLSGGDTAQLINASENLKGIFYDYQGRTSLFYLIFYVLDFLGISDSAQLSWYLGIFTFGAYISFNIFTKLVFHKASRFVMLLMSLFYALNLYTLYIFTYAWGYSHYQILYIFIPVLLGVYIKYIKTKQNIYGALFLLILFFSSSGFSNPAFALSLSIFLLILTILMAILKSIDLDKIMLKRLGVLAGLSIIINAYWILPLIPKLGSGIQDIYSTLDFDWWLRRTSNKIVDTIRLLQTEAMYFPNNYPYEKYLIFKKFFVGLSFLPVFVILFGLFKVNGFSRENRKLFVAFFILLLFFIMLVARITPPFEEINYFIFHLWGLNMLRSYEKTAIVIPFIFSVLILIINIELKKIRKYLLIFSFLILIIPFPFYTGKLQQNMGALFVYDTKDYKRARNSFLVKIPDEYYSIKDIINNDPNVFSVAVLPYNMTETVGWSNYTKWKLNGVDITRYVYNKKFIDANSFHFNDWLFAKDFSESDRNPEWIVKLLGIMNAKYIIFHKDVGPQFLDYASNKINELERKKIINALNKNDYFNLYEIDNAYSFPLIRWQKDRIDIDANPGSVDNNFPEIKNNSLTAKFKVVNPKKYEVDVANMGKDMRYLVFAEPYDQNWKAYATDQSGNTFILNNHFKELGYANGWKIDNPEKISKIIIEYYPMRLAYYGIVISSIAVLFLIGYIVFIWKKNLI